MSYFSEFPAIKLPYVGVMVGSANDKKTYSEVKDILVRYKLSSKVLNDRMAFHNYTWKDNDRPDKTAQLYYGDSSLSWLVMLSSQVFDYDYDFPVSEKVLVGLIESKYNMPIEQAMNEVYEYRDKEGDVIDLQTYTLNAGSSRIVTIYEYEFEQNENKRTVKLISREYVNTIVREFEDTMRKVKKARSLAIGEQVRN